MSLVVTLSGSPTTPSRSRLLADHVGARLTARGFTVEPLDVRTLPAEEVLWANTSGPSVQKALALVERAQAVVVTTPVYKGSYTGILKSFLDLLPQFGLANKVVLPLVTGGTLAHVLSIDYALRPVLTSLGATHITTGLFLLDKLLERSDAGLVVDPQLSERLDGVIAEFARAIVRARTEVPDVVPLASPAATGSATIVA